MPKKELGQHWLKDREILSSIADAADLSVSDTVLEIGPGLGTLTSELLRRAGRVVAVEFDRDLAAKLPGQFPGKKLDVITSDILSFDLSVLPSDYKVVANVPYYITSKIVEKLMTAKNRPSRIVLLVQKEVAERLAAGPGDMSMLSISAQVYAEVSLGPIVRAEYFTPPPKVDSRVVIMRSRVRSIVDENIERSFFRLVKAGFSARRKKLSSSLAGGLSISKQQAIDLLNSVDIDPNFRAQDLSLEQWLALTKVSSK